MKILTYIQYRPDYADSGLDRKDAGIVEYALKIKDTTPGTEVIAMTTGPADAKKLLQECLAMGADDVILLSDEALSAEDPTSEAKIFASAVAKIGDADIIFAGRRSRDDNTAFIGPQIAEELGIPQATDVIEVSCSNDTLNVESQFEDVCEELQLQTPCLLTISSRETNPRYMSIPGILSAAKADITVW